MSVAEADSEQRAQASRSAMGAGQRESSTVGKAMKKVFYFAGFGLSFATRVAGGLLTGRATENADVAQESQFARNDASGPAECAAETNSGDTANLPRQAGAAPTNMPHPSSTRDEPRGASKNSSFSFSGLILNIRDRLSIYSAKFKNFVAVFSKRRDGIWEYSLVTLAYWGLTITDGAIRMLVLFQFYLLGYTAFQIASLFLFYEIFGVVTNLFGGWIGANFGLRITLFSGLGIQVAALTMLALLNPAWPTAVVVGYVMFSQALSGIAKDLTKMSSKSAIKAVIPANADATLYRWVSILTGSKNALKGVGFFVGALLLTVTGFTLSLVIMATALTYLLLSLWRHLPTDLGRTKEKAKFKAMFSMDRRVNILSAARFFLFGARDVWFIVALPVYMSAIFGWSHLVIGAYLALWTIGYGIVQSVAPKFIAKKQGQAPSGHTVYFWALVLTAVPAVIAVALGAGIAPQLVLLGGLAIFGVIFAINSAVHSYMIVYYAESEKVAMTVGFYYMANAGGRLIGTILSGLGYQTFGIIGCLWISAVFVGTSAVISTGLVLPDGRAKLIVTRRRQAALPAPVLAGA